MGYVFLILTIVFESSAVIFMKLSNGFQHKAWAAFAVITYILSFVFLTLSLKDLQAGMANAIWAGSSTLLVAMLGMIFFKEQITLLQCFFFLLIVAGIVGLSLTRTA